MYTNMNIGTHVCIYINICIPMYVYAYTFISYMYIHL